MATSSVATVLEDGRVALPKDIQEEMNLRSGDRLKITSHSSGKITLQLDRVSSETKTAQHSPVSLPTNLDSDPMRLRGFLRDAGIDLNDARAAERKWELAREEWLYGSSSC